jgi:6,7-dimethyl-8-ribityllumazine synthase
VTKTIEGDLDGSGIKIGIVVAKFNEFVTDKLLQGALSGLEENGVCLEDVVVAKVPGSFEIPFVAKNMAESGLYDAIICLGAVIKGETDHYDLVVRESARGIAEIALSTGIPVIFEVLATHTMKLALDRAGGSKGNAGYSGALSAIEVVRAAKNLPT